MLMIAVIAAISGAGLILERYNIYENRYFYYESAERRYRPKQVTFYNYCTNNYINYCDGVVRLKLTNSIEEDALVAEHFASLKQKYARAMTRPWLTVDPDIPLP